MDLFPDSKELLELLTANDVRNLIVGGFALAALGRPQDLVDLMKLVRHVQRE